MTGHTVCTVGFAAIGAVVAFIASLPRTFDTLSKIASLSALFTFISVILAAIFAGIESHPAGYNPDPNHINVAGVKMGGNPLVLVIPAAGTTFVSGMNAFLNISYTFIGQITLPSFIAEMKNPYDFKKALWIVTIAEILVFSLVGGIGQLTHRPQLRRFNDYVQCMDTPALNTTRLPHLARLEMSSTRRFPSHS